MGTKTDTYNKGVVGSILIRLNAAAAVYRRNSSIHEWPVLEVVSFAALTGAVCYLVIAIPVAYVLRTKDMTRWCSCESKRLNWSQTCFKNAIQLREITMGCASK